jgi:hypothetical protein
MTLATAAPLASEPRKITRKELILPNFGVFVTTRSQSFQEVFLNKLQLLPYRSHQRGIT